MKNDAIRQFVRRELRAALTMGVATAIGMGGGVQAVRANPVGGAVISGQGSISNPSATTTLINQQSNSLIINWSSFNVASNETVRFVQPSSTSVALNNILSASPSEIFGKIDANGRVVLINPNGILFSRTAQLNVGSLIASSLELKEFDPTTGHLTFQSLGGKPGVIDNEGTITAGPGGSVALLGGTVLNNGLVVADYGTVAMGAGNVATLDFYGGGLLRLQVSGDLKTNSTGAAAAVQNNGRIQANGGQVVLTASATQDVFASAVDNAGVVKAARVKNVGGVIELLGTDGAATNGGTLDASGADAASTGGTVTVTGNAVSLASTARVDVSGAAGGGSAFIGGGLHGADSSIANASSTSVASGASVDADATNAGNGGTVVVWSDGTTTAHGNLSANAGPSGGDGGLIETSGHDLDVAGGTVRAAAPAGNSGLWLLDPSSVVIGHATSAGGSISGGDNGNGGSPVSDFDINAALATGTDVTIETSKPAANNPTAIGEISFGPNVAIINNGPTAQTLILHADTTIDLTNATPPSITSGTSALNLVLNANVNGQANPVGLGSVTFDGTINVNSLTVTATAAITQTAGSTITVAGATSLTASNSSAITLGNATNAFGGNVAFSGTNVTLGNSAALSTSGTASGNLSETAAGTISEGAAGIQLTGTAGTNTATFTVTGATHDVNLGSTANAFNGETTTIAAGGAGTVGNVRVVDTGTTFVPLTLPNTLTTLVLFDANAPIQIAGETITGTGPNLAGGSGALDVTAGGAITQGGTLVVTGPTALTANGAAGDITLDTNTNAFTGGLILKGNAVTVANTLATTVAGASTAGSLTLDAGGAVAFGTTGTDSTTVTNGLVVQGVNGSGAAGGAVTQVGKLSVGTTTAINTANGNVTLSNAANILTGAVTLTGGTVTLANSHATTLANVTTAGDLTLDAGGAVTFGTTGTDTTSVTNSLVIQGVSGSGAAGGAVSQVGKLSVGNTASIDAGTSNITLSNAANTLAGAVTVTGGAVTLANLDATVLAGADNVGSLTLDAGNTVTFGSAGADSTTVTNGLIIRGVSGSGAAGGGVGQVGTLSVGGTSNINAGANAIALSSTGNSFGSNVAFAAGAVTLAAGGGLSTSGTASGNLSESAAGTISEGAAGIQLTGTAGASTATFTVTGATHDVNLANASNNFNGDATTIQAAGGGTVGNVAVTDSNATFVPLTLPGTVTSLVLDDGLANIVLPTMTLSGVGAGTNLTGGATTLDVTAGGTITQGGGTALSVNGTTNFAAGVNAITVTNPGNSFAGNVGFTGGAVSLASGGALSSSGVARGDLSETAGGTISEGTAGIHLTGTAGTNTATFTVTGAAHDVNLGVAANNFNAEAVTIGASGGGSVANVRVADTNAAFVPLTMPGTLTSLVLSDPNAPIALPGESLTGVGGGTNLAGGGTTLDVTAGGAITESGPLVVDGQTGLHASGGAANITLSNTANQFNGAILLNGNAVTVANTAGTMLMGASTAGSLTLDAGSTVTFGSASADSTILTGALVIQGLSGSGAAGGAVGQFGKLVVGTTTSIDAGANDITLSNSANAFTGAITLSGGAVTLANANATTLAGTNGASALTLDAGGAVAFGTVGTDSTTVANDLIVQGVTGGGPAGGPVTQVGTLSVGGTTDINGGGHAITLDNAANSFGGNVSFVGGAVTLANSGALSSSGTASGSLSETAAGMISEGTTGIQLSGSAANTATFTVTGTTADVDLGNAANNLNGEATTITASGGGAIGNVRVADTNATFAPLTLPTTLASLVLSDPNGSIAVAGETLTGVGAGTNLAGGTTTLDITAGTAITQSGALSVTGATALNAGGGAGDITLSNAANAFNGDVTFTGRDVTLANTAGLTLMGADTANSLTLDAAGAVTQTGTLSVATTTSIDAGTSDIILANSANAFTGGLTLVGGAVTVANSRATTLAGASSANSLTLNAGGAVSETGTLNVATTTSVNAGSNDITLGQANSFGGNVSFSGHNVALTTGTGALTSSGSAGGNLTETSAGAIAQGGALDVSGSTTLAANGGAGDITLGNTANVFAGGVTLSGGAVTLANSRATTFAGTNKVNSLTLNAGGAVSETGTLKVAATTTITAGANDITLDQANSFGGGVTFTGRNVELIAGAGSLTTISGTASGTLTEIAKGSSSNLYVGSLTAGGNLLLIAGSSVLGTSAQSLVTATNAQVRYGLEDPNGQLGSTNPSQQIGFQAASGASQVQLTVWLPAPGTQLTNADLRATQSDLNITKQPFAAGEQAVLYSANFNLTPAEVAGSSAAIRTSFAGTQTQSAVAQSAATQGTQSVLVIDWGSYNPNVSLFGTLNPAVCLPADQRDESGGSGSSCAAASASLLKPPAPIQLAMVPTQEGWKAMPLFRLTR